MSLPSELRVLCFQLSSTPTSDLPRRLPTLQQYVLRCQAPLSSPAANTIKADSSATAVLVHKLKTHLSTLLNGRNPEGRFVAVVLIKAVSEVGGGQVLRGSEFWVRGLLSVLGKPDPVVSKELSVVTLTKIYCMTHQYPTLIREITTPTLPGFITSCLSLFPKGLGQDMSPSLAEAVFRSFTTLLPRHITIYRPFASQIRTVTRSYLAPTLSEEIFIPAALKQSARHLLVLLPQTAAKNGGGEGWGTAVRGIVMTTHVTADSVFRAVIEDWESNAGYVPDSVDINRALSGGGEDADELPRWSGITSGVERLTGLLEMLIEYFHFGTAAPVTTPLGAILDLVSRILAIAVPLSDSSSGHGGPRLHPAIDRDERDGLWCGMPQIHVATLQLLNCLATRLQDSFISIAPCILDQLAWLFPFGKLTPEFRQVAYLTTGNILSNIGSSLDRTQTSKLAPVIRACCKDILPTEPDRSATNPAAFAGAKTYKNGTANQNADTFIQSKEVAATIQSEDTLVVLAAKELLPLFLSHTPQQHLDISLRSLIERTAILAHHKDAMVASVLNPFVGKNGRAMESILPHLTRDYGDDNVVETLLRPRLPPIPSSSSRPATYDAIDIDEDDHMEISENLDHVAEDDILEDVSASAPVLNTQVGLAPAVGSEPSSAPNAFASSNGLGASVPVPSSAAIDNMYAQSKNDAIIKAKMDEDVPMDAGEEDDSDDESVHLTMQLDTDSDSE